MYYYCTCECSYSVADAHQYGGVSRGDVEMVDVEAGDGEAGAADGADEGDDGRGAAVGVAQVICDQ